MIERLVIALLFLGATLLVGFVARMLARRRQRTITAQTVVDGLAGTPRIIAFSGPGCAACASQRRILDGVLADWGGPVDLSYVDAATDVELARRFGVLVVPTVVVAAPDGRIIGITGGIATGSRLREQLSASLTAA